VTVEPDKAVTAQPEQAAQQYRKFLGLDNADPKLRAEAMRRLGDLQVEADDAAKAGDQPQLSPTQLKEAIALYESLLKAYPDFSRNDTVMYQLARAYEAGGQPERALTVLDQLVAKYPNTPWLAEAQFRRGEILFSAKKYTEADRAYVAVLARGEKSGFYDQALYKEGWSLFKLARTDESTVVFFKVLDRVLAPKGTLRERDSLGRAERELSDDTLRVLAISFSDQEGAETLNHVLAQRAEPAYSHLLYEALGNLYIEKERYQDAAVAYEAYAKRRPDDRYAPSLQVRSIEAYQKGGFASLVLEGKQAFVERYAFGSPFWAKRSVDEAPEVAAQLKSNLKDLAQYYHAQAQKTKKPEDYSQAARWYSQFLQSFPSDPDAPATRYLLAEAWFESGHYADAVREYEYTAYQYPAHPKSAAAGYAALVAYQKLEPTLKAPELQTVHRQAIESELMFATSFPDHAESATVQTKAAEELFKLNDFDRTIEVTQQILDRKPPVDDKKQRTATTLLAHSLFDRGRYAEAEKAYVRAQGYLAANDPDQKAITERIAASIYKQAEAKQTAGDQQSAVDDYLRVVTLAPGAKVRANAEFDAATALINMKQWDRAAEVLEGFRKAHPDHELIPDVNRKLAVAYLESGKGALAAAEFERIAARKEETAEVRRTALWQAADLYQKAGNTPAAMRVYTTYVAQFPAPLDAAMDARQHLADAAESAHDTAARKHWLDDIIAADKSAGSARTDRSRYLAAKATLVGVEPVVASFNSLKLSAPLKKSLKEKRDSMEKVLAAYSRALDYNVAEVTTAATFGMAESYRQLAADLMASERPKNLDAEGAEQYTVLLEEQAFPFEEKSIQLHEANAHRTTDGIYDPWVQRSYEVLAKLKPARYAKAEIGEDYVPVLR
jgi:TolA-binding protein